MKSIAIATYPILGCLAEAEKLTEGLRFPWASSTQKATEFIKHFLPRMPDCGLISEMQSRSARTAEPINQWLREKGFSIQLPPDGDLFLASIMELMVKWFSRGTEGNIGEYKAVKLKKNSARVIYNESWLEGKYVVEITTQNNDLAYMYMPAEAPQSEWDVIHLISRSCGSLLKNGSQSDSPHIFVSEKYEGVTFPEIRLDTEPNVSWIEGMSAQGNDDKPLIISTCKQQVRLTLDLEGATVQAASAMVTCRGLGPIPYIIDRPFLFWIRRNGVTDPLVWAYLAPDCWVK